MKIEKADFPYDFAIDVTEDRIYWWCDCERARIFFNKTSQIKHGACHAVEINGEIKVVRIEYCENQDAIILYVPNLKPLIFFCKEKEKVKVLGTSSMLEQVCKIK